jgi:hypothetical protein
VEGGAAEVGLGATRPDIGQGAMLAVPVNRDVQLGPDPFSDFTRHVPSLVQRAVPERHDRHHVRTANAWMHAYVSSHIDLVHSDAHRSNQCLDQPFRLRGQRDDDAMMVGIRVDIKDMGVPGGGTGDRADHVAPPAL